MQRQLLIAAIGSWGMFAAAAGADSLEPGQERFRFVAGWFLPAFNTDVRIDDTDNVGDDVSLGDDLGLDEDQSGALVGFEWRIAERHRLAASYSSFSQNSTRTIDEQPLCGAGGAGQDDDIGDAGNQRQGRECQGQRRNQRQPERTAQERGHRSVRKRAQTGTAYGVPARRGKAL